MVKQNLVQDPASIVMQLPVDFLLAQPQLLLVVGSALELLQQVKLPRLLQLHFHCLEEQLQIQPRAPVPHLEHQLQL